MSSLTVNLSDESLARARRLASLQRVPLEQVIAQAAAEALAAWDEREYLRARAERGKHVDIKSILAQSPDVEPDPNDRID